MMRSDDRRVGTSAPTRDSASRGGERTPSRPRSCAASARRCARSGARSGWRRTNAAAPSHSARRPSAARLSIEPSGETAGRDRQSPAARRAACRPPRQARSRRRERCERTRSPRSRMRSASATEPYGVEAREQPRRTGRCRRIGRRGGGADGRLAAGADPETSDGEPARGQRQRIEDVAGLPELSPCHASLEPALRWDRPALQSPSRRGAPARRRAKPRAPLPSEPLMPRARSSTASSASAGSRSNALTSIAKRSSAQISSCASATMCRLGGRDVVGVRGTVCRSKSRRRLAPAARAPQERPCDVRLAATRARVSGWRTSGRRRTPPRGCRRARGAPRAPWPRPLLGRGPAARRAAVAGTCDVRSPRAIRTRSCASCGSSASVSSSN